MTGQATSKDGSKHAALEGMEYQLAVNQTGHHPMSASHRRAGRARWVLPSQPP
jgi:hypothetical protein